MTIELLNSIIANAPVLGVLVYYAKKIGEIAERLSKLEGKVDGIHQSH